MKGELTAATAVGPGMIKRKFSVDPPSGRHTSTWLDLEHIAEVEVSSEDAAHPVECALFSGQPGGWQAEQPGRQSLRLVFPEPQPLREVRLVFEEHQHARTQQFILSVDAADGRGWREIVRQQFNFSPSGSTREEECYELDGSAVAGLELAIIPDIAGGAARASVQELRIA